MKIAELFVALGFQVQGSQQLKQTSVDLQKAHGVAVGLLATVAALNAAFYAMIASGTKAAVVMGKFAVTTGLSSVELQRWQKEAATFNVNGDEIRDTLEGINKAQADIKLGQGNVAPFQFFGLSVNQSAFDVLKKFAEVSRNMDAGIARTMASQLGISDNVFQFLRQSNLDLERFNKNLFVTEAEQAKLVRLNRTWQDLVNALGSVKNKFAATFAEPLTRAAEILTVVVDKMGKFVDWLQQATPAATTVRWVLFGLVAALGAALIVLTALTAALSVLIAGFKLAAIGILPFLAALAPVLIVVGLIVGAFAALILLIDDFEGAIAGKESLFDWNDGLLLTIKNVNRLADGIGRILEVGDKVGKALWFLDPRELASFAGGKYGESLARPSTGSAGSRSITQENNINVNIDGASNPAATGREVGKSVKQAVIDTSGQLAPIMY